MLPTGSPGGSAWSLSVVFNWGRKKAKGPQIRGKRWEDLYATRLLVFAAVISVLAML
jgi:hypothetical protein